jgi:hypothetical protein
MDQLKEYGISLGTSTFSKLVRKFALENKVDLLSDLLSSDQHPGALEDLNLQESLLASYHEARDWRQLTGPLQPLQPTRMGMLQSRPGT